MAHKSSPGRPGGRGPGGAVTNPPLGKTPPKVAPGVTVTVTQGSKGGGGSSQTFVGTSQGTVQVGGGGGQVSEPQERTSTAFGGPTKDATPSQIAEAKAKGQDYYRRGQRFSSEGKVIRTGPETRVTPQELQRIKAEESRRVSAQLTKKIEAKGRLSQRIPASFEKPEVLARARGVETAFTDVRGPASFATERELQKGRLISGLSGTTIEERISKSSLGEFIRQSPEKRREQTIETVSRVVPKVVSFGKFKSAEEVGDFVSTRPRELLRGTVGRLPIGESGRTLMAQASFERPEVLAEKRATERIVAPKRKELEEFAARRQAEEELKLRSFAAEREAKVGQQLEQEVFGFSRQEGITQEQLDIFAGERTKAAQARLDLELGIKSAEAETRLSGEFSRKQADIEKELRQTLSLESPEFQKTFREEERKALGGGFALVGSIGENILKGGATAVVGAPEFALRGLRALQEPERISPFLKATALGVVASPLIAGPQLVGAALVPIPAGKAVGRIASRISKDKADIIAVGTGEARTFASELGKVKAEITEEFKVTAGKETFNVKIKTDEIGIPVEGKPSAIFGSADIKITEPGKPKGTGGFAVFAGEQAEGAGAIQVKTFIETGKGKELIGGETITTFKARPLVEGAGRLTQITGVTKRIGGIQRGKRIQERFMEKPKVKEETLAEAFDIRESDLPRTSFPSSKSDLIFRLKAKERTKIAEIVGEKISFETPTLSQLKAKKGKVISVGQVLEKEVFEIQTPQGIKSLSKLETNIFGGKQITKGIEKGKFVNKEISAQLGKEKITQPFLFLKKTAKKRPSKKKTAVTSFGEGVAFAGRPTQQRQFPKTTLPLVTLQEEFIRSPTPIQRQFPKSPFESIALESVKLFRSERIRRKAQGIATKATAIQSIASLPKAESSFDVGLKPITIQRLGARTDIIPITRQVPVVIPKLIQDVDLVVKPKQIPVQAASSAIIPFIPGFTPFRPFPFAFPIISEVGGGGSNFIFPTLGRKSKKKFRGTPSLSVVGLGKLAAGTKLTKKQLRGEEFISPLTIRKI